MSENIVTSEMTKTVAEKWFSALKSGNADEIFSCLDENVLWINNPPEKGLSDIIPWLGEYHGLEAVKGTFDIWNRLSQVQNFELKKLTIDNDEALAVVHEVATIKATGLNYDIEFIQRLRVANNKIVSWKSYWDTAKGIVSFRGDMQSRLINAAKANNMGEALLVIPFGADPNTVDSETNQTVLMTAASRGYSDFVDLLLQYGADPNLIDRKAGVSALHKACQGGHLEVVKILVEYGAFINHQATITGHTPLIEAIWYKSSEIVDYFIRLDARIELKTYYGFSIDQHVDFAIKVNQNEEALEQLTKIKDLIAKRRAGDIEKKSSQILNMAVLNGDLESVKEALKQKVDIEKRYPIVGGFSDGHTPLLIAARDGHQKIVETLIEAGANVNAIEPIFGAVPLHKATYNGYVGIAKLLTEAKGINLNYQGPSNGYTPLQDSLWHGYANCAEVLLNAGARTDIVAYDGKIALDIAIQELGINNFLTQKLLGSIDHL